MHLLILGLSSIVQRRVLPALRRIDAVEQIDVATRQAASGTLRDSWGLGDVFDSYSEALERTRADVVYVSLPNSAHEEWAEKALGSGAHVIVDKPAFLGATRAERLVALADRQGCCLAEATVYGYHPQIQCARTLFDCEEGSRARRVVAIFSFPPLPDGNFRYVKALGGGALWDLGPYAVSLGRIFFGEQPQSLMCDVLATTGAAGVETAFSVMATYPGGRSMVGHFGWDTVYRNRVEAIGERIGAEIDRVFTTPPDTAASMRVIRPSGTETMEGPIGDAFALFLGHVFDSIGRRSWGGLHADLLADAQALRQLREAAGVGNAD